MRVYHFICAKYGLEAIKNRRLKIARFDELNDPFELYAADMSDKRHRSGFRKFKSEMNERFGLLCFSKDWKQPLLWSHYSNKHKGVALIFDIDDELISQINYSPDRLKVNIEHEMERGGLTEDVAYDLMTTKSDIWHYEGEVRIHVRLDEQEEKSGLYFADFHDRFRLVGVIFGPLCELEDSDVQSVLPQGEKISVMNARLAFKSYKISKRLDLGERIID